MKRTVGPLFISSLSLVSVIVGYLGAGKVTGRATDITDCSVLMKCEALPADRTPLSVPSDEAVMVTDDGVLPSTLGRFLSC